MTSKLYALIGFTVLIMAAAVALLVLPGKESPITPPPPPAYAQIAGVVEVSAPAINATVSSPLVVTGRAAGWYFEASFPIELRDAQGAIIAQGYAEAQGDWMTSEFVPFVSVPLTFAPQPQGSVGELILRKDNPSGLPEHDQHLTVPVRF